jgi:hypothetical protein
MIKYATKKFSFGDAVCIVGDPEKNKYILVGVVLHPSYRETDPAVPRFILSYGNGETFTLYDFEVYKDEDDAPTLPPADTEKVDEDDE